MSQNSAMPITATPAGWYADPNGQPAQRWWDGQAWTEHLQPILPPQPPTPVPAQQFANAPAYGQPTVAAAQSADPTVAAYGQPAAVTPPSAPGFGVPAGIAYPVQPVAHPATHSGRYNPYDSAADLRGGKNTPARNALILGIFSLIVNPFCLPAIAAIGWGIVGIKRARVFTDAGLAPVGKGKAITGLVLGSVGLVATIILKGFFF